MTRVQYVFCALALFSASASPTQRLVDRLTVGHSILNNPLESRCGCNCRKGRDASEAARVTS